MVIPERRQGGPADPGVGDGVILLVPGPGAAHRVDLAVDDRGGERIAGREHGLLVGPGVGQRVVLLVRRQRGPVASSEGVQLAAHGRRAQDVPRRGHGSPDRPGVGHGVVLLVLRQHAGVAASQHIDPAVDDRGRRRLPPRRCRGLSHPAVADRVVLLVGAQVASVEPGQRVDLPAHGGGGQVAPHGGHGGLGGPYVARAPAGVDPVAGHVDRGLREVAVGEGRALRVGRGRDGVGGDLVEIDVGRHGGVQRRAQDEEGVVRRAQRVVGLDAEVVGGVVRDVRDRRVGVGGLRG